MRGLLWKWERERGGGGAELRPFCNPYPSACSTLVNPALAKHTLARPATACSPLHTYKEIIQ